MLDFYLVIIIVNIVSLTEKLSTISTSFEFTPYALPKLSGRLFLSKTSVSWWWGVIIDLQTAGQIPLTTLRVYFLLSLKNLETTLSVLLF